MIYMTRYLPYLLPLFVVLLFQANGSTMEVTISPNIVGSTNTTLQVTISNISVTIPKDGFLELTLVSGINVIGNEFALSFNNIPAAQLVALSNISYLISNFGVIDYAPFSFQIISTNDSNFQISQNQSVTIMLEILDNKNQPLEMLTTNLTVLPATITPILSTGMNQLNTYLILSFSVPTALPANFEVLMMLPYLDEQGEIPLLDQLDYCRFVNIAQSISCSQISPIQIRIVNNFTSSVSQGTQLQYEVGSITLPYKVGALYYVQAYIQISDGGTVAQGNSTTIVALSPLDINTVGAISADTQVSTQSNLTLSFRLSWILPANSTLIITFNSDSIDEWVNLTSIISSPSQINSTQFTIKDSSLTVYSLSNQTFDNTAFNLTLENFMNPPCISFFSFFNVSIMSSDRFVIYNYNSSTTYPVQAARISTFMYNSTSLEFNSRTNITVQYQFPTSLIQGTVRIFLPTGMQCTSFTECQTVPISNISCQVDCSTNTANFSLFQINSGEVQKILLKDLINPIYVSNQLFFEMETYYQIDQNLYLAQILDPAVEYMDNIAPIKMLSFVSSSYTTCENATIDLYFLAQATLNLNEIFVVNYSSTLNFYKPSNVTINIPDANSSTNPSVEVLESSLILTNLPLIPINEIFIISFYNVSLPRAVGMIGAINFTFFYNNQSLINNSTSNLISTYIEAKHSNEIIIKDINLEQAKLVSNLEITLNFTLPSAFEPNSDYLKISYPSEVSIDYNYAQYLTSSPLTHLILAKDMMNYTITLTFLSEISQGAEISISLLVTTNSPLEEIQEFKLTFYDNQDALIAQSQELYPTQWIMPFPFQNISINISNPLNSNQTNFTFEVPLSLQIPANGSLVVTIPSEFDTNSSSCIASSSDIILSCTNFLNQSFMISSTINSIAASDTVNLFIQDIGTPSEAGNLVLTFIFESRSGGNDNYALQKGTQTYEVYLGNGHQTYDSFESYGGYRWFPLLTINCGTIILLAILQHILFKKYNVYAFIVAFWSIAEFPCLVYLIYYHACLELLPIKEPDFSAYIVITVTFLLLIDMVAHIREILFFKRIIKCDHEQNRLLRLIWKISIVTNHKLVWLLALKRKKLSSENSNNFCYPNIYQNICGLIFAAVWLSICSIIEYSKAILDTVYQRNGYYLLIEFASYFLASAILTLYFALKIKKARRITEDKYESDQIMPPQANNGIHPPKLQDDEGCQSPLEENQESELPNSVSASPILLDVNLDLNISLEKCPESSFNLPEKTQEQGRSEIGQETKPNFINATPEKTQSFTVENTEPFVEQKKKKSSKSNNKHVDSPFKILMENLTKVKDHFTQRA